MKRPGFTLAGTLVGMVLVTMILLTIASTMAASLKSNTYNSTATQSTSDLTVTRQTLQQAFYNPTVFAEFTNALPAINAETSDIIFTTRTDAALAGERCRISYNAALRSIQIQYGNPIRLTEQLGQGHVTGWSLKCDQLNMADSTMRVVQTINWNNPANTENPNETYTENMLIKGTILFN